MRRITRPPLQTATATALTKRQAEVDAKRAAGNLDIEGAWRSARQTKPLKTVHAMLRTMAGTRERCMYCCDSHGTDIEHFWPKAGHPDRMFAWLNLLLCCTECGRFKGNRFPLRNGHPQLVDPTAEDPWQFLDFDPATGVIVARFDPAANDESPKGTETVRLLQLDRREALNDGYLKTWRRLTATVESALGQVQLDANTLATALEQADDHGLLGWCFSGTGQKVAPFSTLRAQHPHIWAICAQTLT